MTMTNIDLKPESKPQSKHTPATDGLSQAKTIVTDFLENDPKAQATELGKQLSAEVTVFIKNNPWVAMLGAAAIGYWLGAKLGSTNRGRK
jgi:ElaB/YqjD/DUF883 family membrane-anchored ribosome-binding protein